MRRVIVATSVMLLSGSPAGGQFLEPFEESRWGVRCVLSDGGLQPSRRTKERET